MATGRYADSVFINCPFDGDYRPIFDALVFAVHDRPAVAIRIVRDWLRAHSPFGTPSGVVMAGRFNQFRRHLPTMCRAAGLDPASLIFVDYAALVTEWLKTHPV